MTSTKNILVLTDHQTHLATNSLYGLVNAFISADVSIRLAICSRSVAGNHAFFAGDPTASLRVTWIERPIRFEAFDALSRETDEVSRDKFDAILLRLPQPVDPYFLRSLLTWQKPEAIINQPEGVLRTSSKAFLTELADMCPSPRIVTSMEEAVSMSWEEEIVLKPFYSYGGKGILRLSHHTGWIEDEAMPVSEWMAKIDRKTFPMLAMRFLPNVTEGDKRNVIVDGHHIASAIRYPAPGSWMCNVAQGGHAELSVMEEEEKAMEQRLTPMLRQLGIIMYGFDTLVNENGLRVLSEINTVSIGGLVPMEEMSGQPVTQKIASLLLEYWARENVI